MANTRQSSFKSIPVCGGPFCDMQISLQLPLTESQLVLLKVTDFRPDLSHIIYKVIGASCIETGAQYVAGQC